MPPRVREGVKALVWQKARKRAKSKLQQAEFSLYQDDPVGFGEEVLGESYTDDIVEVMESVRDYPITIVRSANGTGKTHCAARLAFWFFACFPESQVWTTAAPPLKNLKTLLWGEIESIKDKNPPLFHHFGTKTLRIARNSKSFIEGVSIPTTGTVREREAKFSGKHAPQMLFIVDEGDAVPEEVYKGIESCMSGGMNRLLIMFNPRQKAGMVWNMEMEGRANVVEVSAFNHPNVVTGEDVIPGAVDREKTGRRVNKWCRPLVTGEEPDDSCFILPEHLEGYVAKSESGVPYPPLKPGWYKILDPEFYYMVLGIYPILGENQLISEDDINRAFANYRKYEAEFGDQPPQGTRPRMALDPAEFGPDYNMVCLRYGSYVPRMKFWNGVDTDETALKARKLYWAKGAYVLIIDANGLGSGIGPRVVREDQRLRREELLNGGEKIVVIPVKGSEKPLPFVQYEEGEFRYLRDQLLWLLREWLRNDPNAKLYPDPMLMQEMLSLTYERHGKYIRVKDNETVKAELKRSPDRLMALAHTFAPHNKAKVLKVGS